VAAILLARAGWRVRVLERLPHLGGAAVSAQLFDGVQARVSRYSYLVSLLSPALRSRLGLSIRLARRPYSWCAEGLLVGEDADGGPEYAAWQGMIARAARALAPTLLEPLRSREQLLGLLEPHAREALFEQPLAVSLQRALSCDLLRGVVATDALIGTFASAAERSLRQNRCLLYHVLGGSWDVPVGGMGALAGELERRARAAGAQLVCGAEVTAIAADGKRAEVRCADGTSVRARHVLAALAPAVLSRLLGEAVGPRGGDRPEGSQLKVNMLLRRLPRLRPRARVRRHAARQRALRAAAARPCPGRRRADPRARAVRALLPLAHRSEHPLTAAARRRRAHADGVRAAHARAAVRRRSRRRQAPSARRRA